MIGMRARARRGIFMKRTCKQCGKEFELSDSEINFYKSKGLELPKRCQACRNQNKGQSGKVQETAKGNGSYVNDKSRILITAAAVILLLAFWGIKNLLSVPDENLFLGIEDQVSSSWQPESEHGQQTWDGGETQPSGGQTGQSVSGGMELERSSKVASEILQETPDVTYSFRKESYLTEHFEKHGAEFPYETEEEYLAGANNVIRNPEALHKLEAEDGDDVYFVENTNEFVVVSADGFIRTYFKADIDYYNRQ